MKTQDYDKYSVRNGKVLVTEYGYCPGNSVTDNPDEIYRIVTVHADEFLQSEEDGFEETLEQSTQYIEDCTEKKYLERLEELKKYSTIRDIKEIRNAPDGEYISLGV